MGICLFRCLKQLSWLLFVFGLAGCHQKVETQPSFTFVSHDDMLVLVQDQHWVLLDVRNSNWFNGWVSPETVVGGRIPGARNFDVNWLTQHQSELDKMTETLFQQKGMRNAPGIVLYGDDQFDASMLAKWLVIEQGFDSKHLRILSSGFSGWVEAGGDVEILPGYQRLVTSEWLEQQQKKQEPPVVLDISFGPGIRYRLTHIPGALHVNSNWIESKPLWNVVEKDELRQILLNLGVTQNSQVVVYGEDMTAAARLVTVLGYAGIADIRLLNGGWKAWTNAGYPTESGWRNPVKATKFGDNNFTDVLINTDQVNKIRSNEDEYLVSVRSWLEFTGETSGYRYIKPKGRIPGAVWGRSGSDPYHMQDYLNPDNTLRDTQDIFDHWRDFSPDKESVMAFYCGTGWRAGLSWFAATLMGYKNAVIYDGGWYEWSMDSSRPREAG